MEKFKHHSTESLDAVIGKMTEDLKALKKARKPRSDSGVKRERYVSNLPPMYRRYITSANKRSISFQLSVEEFDIVTSSSCTYCGSTSKVGVDRIDSSEGYHVENVQPCCGVCNLMKYTYTEEFFLRHIIKIVKQRKLT